MNQNVVAKKSEKMKIHEDYKCEKCNGCHYVDYEKFIRNHHFLVAQDLERKNQEVRINDQMAFSPLEIVRSCRSKFKLVWQYIGYGPRS